MSRTEFNRVTEQQEFQSFMEELKNKVHIAYVSNLSFIPYVTTDNQTAVYIETRGNKITVFVENGKPNSLKTAA